MDIAPSRPRRPVCHEPSGCAAGLNFLANYERGSRSSTRLMTVFVLANGGAAARLGIAATRKLGNAVQRNRAKRLVREAFRRHKPLAALDVIVIPKREMLVADYRAVEADYCAILLQRRQQNP